MSNDQKNLFAAMGLSLLVIVAWQYFFAMPEAQRVQQQKDRAQQAQNLPQPGAPPVTGNQPGSQTPTAPSRLPGAPGAAQPGAASVLPRTQLSREQAIAASPRVNIETPNITGSIDLRGARLNNVELKKYRKTIKKDSGRIELLSPANAPNPYYVQTGFVAQDSQLKLPQPDTLWSSNDSTISPGKPATLTWDNGQGLIFKRTVSVDENYLFTFKDTVQNNSSNAVTLFPYALVARVGMPKTEGFYVLHEGLVGIVGDSKVQEISYSGILKENNSQRVLRGKGGWIGITDKYWSAAVIPDQNVEFQGRFAAFPGARPTFQTDVLGPATVVQPRGTAETTHLVFAGAKESDVIDAYQAKHNIKNFDLMIDWGWFYFITKPLFQAIDFIYRYVGNFGIAILLITVLIKLLFFPLANRSYESMAKMKAVQPEMKALQERYASDKQTMQKELMALYKREKINPIAGCWPVLLQIPVFFALYKVIFITIEMRHAPFFGWIQDLSAPDPTNIFNLFGLLPFDPTQIPLMGPFLWVGIWPLLMGVSMFVQMKMNPEPTDPIQKTMFAWMPVIFTFMLGAFPVGLVIYWTWNNILSVAQQYYIMRKQGVKVELWDNLANLFKKKTA